MSLLFHLGLSDGCAWCSPGFRTLVSPSRPASGDVWATAAVHKREMSRGSSRKGPVRPTCAVQGARGAAGAFEARWRCPHWHCSGAASTVRCKLRPPCDDARSLPAAGCPLSCPWWSSTGTASPAPTEERDSATRPRSGKGPTSHLSSRSRKA